MYNLPNDFQTNCQGQLSQAQIRRIVYWILIGPVMTVFCGLGFALGIKGLWGWLIGAGILLLASIMLWRYGLDLWERCPGLKTGTFHKERIAVRGPTHYEIVFSDDERLRALNKQQWETLQEGRSYRVFFTKRTKWLLSYQLAESDDKPEAFIDDRQR